jgi:hypothetical protein
MLIRAPSTCSLPLGPPYRSLGWKQVEMHFQGSAANREGT